jgi:hypothetical protein
MKMTPSYFAISPASPYEREIQAFCKWLIEKVFDGELLTNIKLESVFASGSLILSLAQQQSVIILEDGQLKVPVNAAFWGDLSERVLKTIVKNSQRIDDVPSFWKNEQLKIRQLLYTLTEWHSTPFLNNLRNRASKLLEDDLEVFKDVLLRENLKLTEEKFNPKVELSSQNRLPEIRPEKSIDISTPERDNYLNKLTLLSQQSANISEFDLVVQEIVTNTVQVRRSFEKRLASPLAETALPALAVLSFEQPDRLNLVLATYLRQEVSKLSLDSKFIRSGDLIQESLANQAAWMDIINRTASTDDQVLSNWSKLEIWDGLRGRLAQLPANDGDRNVTQYLSQKLPDWLQGTNDPPAGLDLNAIRPTLAELAHLGVSLPLGTYQALTDRVEALASRSDLKDELKALLAAMRLELGVTAIASGITPSEAFKQFESPSTKLSEFADWIKKSIESSNVWESRAGMNGLILLARLAEGTGDLFINSTIRTAAPSGSRALRLVSQSVGKLLSTTAGNKGSGLPLAFAAFDLARYARNATLSIAPDDDSSIPVWAPKPIPEFLDRLATRLGTATRTSLKTLLAEGGIGLKLLVLSLLQIKLDELNWERQLTVKPLRRNAFGDEAKLRHNIVLNQVDDLQKAVRFVFCREQLLLNELPEALSEIKEIKPWWQTRYWLASSSNIQENGQLDTIGSVISTPEIISKLDRQLLLSKIPEIQSLLSGLSAEATVSSVLRWQRWLILDPQDAGSNKTYLIEKDPKVSNLKISKVEIPFSLVNWTASYSNNVETSLLSLAANLETGVPVVPENNPQDIDGRYEGEFPDLSWKDTTDNLQKAVEKLKEIEGKYDTALREQIDGNRADEIANLLKQPLLLNTADYKEQMLAAIAEVREAEADLQVAEFESLAAQFEVFANEMLYKAAEVEAERQSVLVEVSKLDKEIAQLQTDADAIKAQQVNGEITIKQRDVKIAKNIREKALKESEKVKMARKAILSEIELLRNLLETPTKVTINGTEITAKGQIGAMAHKVEATLIKKLNEDLVKAKEDLQKAEDAEAERKKKEKRRKLIGGICRFIGSVVGAVYGGPAGAALGAEIGGAIGELANGIIDNKAPEDILVGLIDNGFAIAKAAGFNPEQELNKLGAKGAKELDQLFSKLDSSLQPLLNNLPTILDEKLFKDAIVVLDLGEIPELTKLVELSYGDLKKDIGNLGNLGTALTNAKTGQPIQFDSPKQFLDHLTNNLFSNTKGNTERIIALSQAIGKKVDDLQTDKGLQDAAERLAKLVVTQVGQEASNFRQDTIVNWIRGKREKAEWWNEVVEEEARSLVKELFPDTERQGEVIANLASSLLNPEIIRGELQTHLDPWQKELDKRIKDITEVKDAATTSPPNSALAAAEQSVKHLEDCIKQFNLNLLPWLKGDGNTQRTDLLLKLNALQTQKLPTNNIDLEIGKLDEANAQLSETNAQAALKNMEQELERVGLLYKAADINVSKYTLLNKVANLSKLRATNLQGAQENSLKASEKRQQAAQAKVKSAQFNLEAKKALSQGAVRRGAESSRIRGMLSQPALQLPNLAANATNRLRSSYLEALESAFRSYRELLRFYDAIGITTPSVEPISEQWSSFLEKHKEQLTNPSDKNDRPSVKFETIEWDLTPEQISSLLSPDGFRVVLASDITEAPHLFSVGKELQSYLETNKLANSPWIKEFAQVGINLSDKVTSELDGSGPNWKITDNQTRIVPITAYDEKGNLSHTWNIQSEAISYTATDEGNTLTVSRRQLPLSEGRSPYPNQYWDKIDSKAIQTGRLVGVFLDAPIGSSTQRISGSDYKMKVNHLGDFWVNSKQVKLLHSTLELMDNRTIFLQATSSPPATLDEINKLAKSEGDPPPYTIQGTPLSGTINIHLESLGNKQFNKVKLWILYKYYT